MDELIVIKNASLLLRLIHHLIHHVPTSLKFLTVLYLDHKWVVRLRTEPMGQAEEENLESFLWEIGEPCQLFTPLSQVMMDLELGCSPLEVMHQYSIPVISHGEPSAREVRIFQHEFIDKLENVAYPELTF